MPVIVIDVCGICGGEWYRNSGEYAPYFSDFDLERIDGDYPKIHKEHVCDLCMKAIHTAVSCKIDELAEHPRHKILA